MLFAESRRELAKSAFQAEAFQQRRTERCDRAPQIQDGPFGDLPRLLKPAAQGLRRVALQHLQLQAKQQQRLRRIIVQFASDAMPFLLLGTARGHALSSDVTSATSTLLEAEQAAPEEIRHNPEARSLASRLLSISPGRDNLLHELAARMSADITLTGPAGTPR